MKTTRTRPEHRAGRTALVIAALLAVTGCLGPTRAGPYPFTVRFANVTIDKGQKSCPVEVSMAKEHRNCRFSKSDCVRALRGEKVTFTMERGSPPFAVRFTPFESAVLDLRGEPKDFVIAGDAPKKSYTFSVTADGCPPLDPEIIVAN